VDGKEYRFLMMDGWLIGDLAVVGCDGLLIDGGRMLAIALPESNRPLGKHSSPEDM
jgi:hypothetical protein